MTGITEEAKVVAQREFDLIQDLLRTPLREDLSEQVLPDRRRWIGGCLPAVEIADLPDLIPVPGNPNAEGDPRKRFCNLQSGREILWVTVMNQGTADAGPSVTEVIFKFNDGKPNRYAKKYTDPIPKGQTSVVDFEIPDMSIAQMGFEFTIIVDANEDVTESNEDNNRAEGLCEPDFIIKASGEQI